VHKGRPNSEKFLRQEECKEQMNERDSTFVWSKVIAGKGNILLLLIELVLFYMGQ
jgi:hypothetical protein